MEKVEIRVLGGASFICFLFCMLKMRVFFLWVSAVNGAERHCVEYVDCSVFVEVGVGVVYWVSFLGAPQFGEDYCVADVYLAVEVYVSQDRGLSAYV